MDRILIMFRHGLGDAVQFTVVLRHLQKYRPDWEIDVFGLQGKQSAWRGLCRNTFTSLESIPPPSTYRHVFDLSWAENYGHAIGRPSTKVTRCLTDVFKLPYNPELARYKIDISKSSIARASSYLASIGCTAGPDGRYNAVILHYQGNTSRERKDLRHEDAAVVVDVAIEAGCIPVILDWDKRSPLPDQRRVFNPPVGKGDMWGGFGSGDAEVIAALVKLSRLFVGIDSGPSKCASAEPIETPALVVWTHHHPIHFHDPSPNTIHLVPDNHVKTLLRGREEVATYFRNQYAHEIYSRPNLSQALAQSTSRLLGVDRKAIPFQMRSGFFVHDDRPEQDWVIIEDIYLKDAYRTHLIPKREDEEVVVDVGAHIGAFAKLWHERNPRSKIICVEVEPSNVQLLRRNVGRFATVIDAALVGRKTGSPTYLLNAVTPNARLSRSTGGSRVVGREEFEREADAQYFKEPTSVLSIELRHLMEQFKLSRIDLLKLDCEGSEFDILEHAPLDRIGFILGEYHGWNRFQSLLTNRMHVGEPGGWDFGHMSQSGDLGVFHLRKPRGAVCLYVDGRAVEDPTNYAVRLTHHGANLEYGGKPVHDRWYVRIESSGPHGEGM